MTFGNEADWSDSKEIYALSRDSGLNFFDCANIYTKGEFEKEL